MWGEVGHGVWTAQCAQLHDSHQRCWSPNGMPSTVPHNPRWEVPTVPTSQRGTLRPGKWQMGDLRGPGPTLSGPGR